METLIFALQQQAPPPGGVIVKIIQPPSEVEGLAESLGAGVPVPPGLGYPCLGHGGARRLVLV